MISYPLHKKDGRLSALLSGAAYRLRNLTESIITLNSKELSELFRPKIISIINEMKNTNTIEALDELVQLTPQGLYK